MEVAVNVQNSSQITTTNITTTENLLRDNSTTTEINMSLSKQLSRQELFGNWLRYLLQVYAMWQLPGSQTVCCHSKHVQNEGYTSVLRSPEITKPHKHSTNIYRRLSLFPEIASSYCPWQCYCPLTKTTSFLEVCIYFEHICD